MKERRAIDLLNKTIILSRQQLYNEIWQISVAGVARKYNLNYPKLIAKCKEADLPFPPSGYWTRKNMGIDVTGEVVTLPPSNIENMELLLAGAKVEKKKKVELKQPVEAVVEETGDSLEKASVSIEQKVEEKLEEVIVPIMEENIADDTVLTFLESEEKKHVLRTASELNICDKKKLHEQLIKYKKSMSEWKRKEKEIQNKRGYNSRYNRLDNEPMFFNEISVESYQRAFLILDAIFCAVEKLGGKVNEDLSMRVKSDVVRIRIAEGQDKIKHELTQQEAREVVEYNDRLKHNQWASKPQIRKYDYIYNGKLRIVFGDGEYVRDNVKEKLEDRLGDILLRLYEKSEETRIQRERWEEEQRKREEEARRKEEVRKKKETEVRKTKELLNQVEDYRIACEIRQYITAVTQQNKITSELIEWIEWAKKKADWYDPTVAAEDEYLGKREHSKSREEKDLDRINKSYVSWGW